MSSGTASRFYSIQGSGASLLGCYDDSTFLPFELINVPAGTYKVEIMLEVNVLDSGDELNFYASAQRSGSSASYTNLATVNQGDNGIKVVETTAVLSSSGSLDFRAYETFMYAEVQSYCKIIGIKVIKQ
jgi:hypothetical protein